MHTYTTHPPTRESMKLLSACLSLLLPNAAVLGEKGLTWPHRPNDISEDFGHDMLKYFMMRPGYTNLNNGAFGTGCKDAVGSLFA